MTHISIRIESIALSDESPTFTTPKNFGADRGTDIVHITNWEDGTELASFSIADLYGRDAPCWRCSAHVTATVEVAFVDLEGRTDCPESEDGAPHEIDEPE